MLNFRCTGDWGIIESKKYIGGGIMNIRELAAEIGVSPATVSIVLNDRPGVSDETRKRIK